MSKTLRAVIRKGKIEPLEQVDLPEGSKVLVTLVPEEESDFWLEASQASLDTIWANPEDDVYARLLKE
jgi:predicted DNA-binding antitoxin AbrB/MazE fold protein